jgi:hypothetical protein
VSEANPSPPAVRLRLRLAFEPPRQSSRVALAERTGRPQPCKGVAALLARKPDDAAAREGRPAPLLDHANPWHAPALSFRETL